MFVFVVEFIYMYMDVLCSFYVEDYVEIVFFIEVIFWGESFIINGWMIGVEKFVIECSGLVEFGGIVYIVKLFEEFEWFVDNFFDLFIFGFIVFLLLVIINFGLVRIKLIFVKVVLDIVDMLVKKGYCVFMLMWLLDWVVL